MKTKSRSKFSKLVLNKETIAHLNAYHMKRLAGGRSEEPQIQPAYTGDENDTTCITSCFQTCTTCPEEQLN